MVALAVVYSLSCAWLAGAAVARVPRAREAGFLPVYTALLAAVAGLSVWRLSPEPVVARIPVSDLLLGLAAGVAAGIAAIAAEKLVMRMVLRRARASGRARRAPARRPAVSPPDPQAHVRPPDRGPKALALLLAVAALEEVLFRGVLLDLALSLPGPALPALAVLGIVLAFALTHVAFGWAQVLAKLPLSALATLTTLVTGSVVAAVVAHMLVNHRAWRA